MADISSLAKNDQDEGVARARLTADILRAESFSKRALLGRDNYVFLINETNSEIRQHLLAFSGGFNEARFVSDKKFRADLVTVEGNQRGSPRRYAFCVVPDKTIVCYKMLPFDWHAAKMHRLVISAINNSGTRFPHLSRIFACRRRPSSGLKLGQSG